MTCYDIVLGHYLFYRDYHGGQASEFYRRLCHIQEYFNPGPLEPTLNAESVSVYFDLCYKHNLPDPCELCDIDDSCEDCRFMV